jgi:diacylglycerol kinase (ATP)
LATYIRESIKNFFTAKAYPFLIQANDTSIETEAFFISIANSNQFGNHVTIAPQASISDGLLDIVVVNKMSKVKMVYTLLVQIRLGQVKPASEANLHGINYFQAKKLSIINKGKAPLHIDGEPASTPDFLEIEVIPGAFRLLTP